MRYNFKRLEGREWIQTIRNLRRRGLTFLEVPAENLYNPLKVRDVFTVYYSRTATNCKIVYYVFDNDRWHKRLRQISFQPREIDPVRCVLIFKKIAGQYGELLPFEPYTPYDNGVYMYYGGQYKGYITSLDINSAYLWALQQPLADWETKVECSARDVWLQTYDFYCFENELHRRMFYKEDLEHMSAAMLWADVKIYGFTASRHYIKTAAQLYKLKHKNKEKYKNVANIAIGCMHKRESESRNNQTIAASLYAYFEWYNNYLVDAFQKKGYKVIMVTTDAVKIVGKYNESDNIVKLGDGLGEFKIEYEGEAIYYSSGHYEEADTKWKGVPKYMRHGLQKCNFIELEDLKKERKVYEKYTIT